MASSTMDMSSSRFCIWFGSGPSLTTAFCSSAGRLRWNQGCCLMPAMFSLCTGSSTKMRLIRSLHSSLRAIVAGNA